MIRTPHSAKHDLTATRDSFRADAQKAVTALKQALDEVGITLPSLGVDPSASFSSPVVLVELGRARPDVVHALAEVIRKEAKGGS